MRPPGYEPGELPTAPLRDIYRSFLFAGAKVRLFCDMTKSFVVLSACFNIYLSLEMYA